MLFQFKARLKGFFKGAPGTRAGLEVGRLGLEVRALVVVQVAVQVVMPTKQVDHIEFHDDRLVLERIFRLTREPTWTWTLMYSHVCLEVDLEVGRRDDFVADCNTSLNRSRLGSRLESRLYGFK